jgi:hypothetical protein
MATGFELDGSTDIAKRQARVFSDNVLGTVPGLVENPYRQGRCARPAHDPTSLPQEPEQRHLLLFGPSSEVLAIPHLTVVAVPWRTE